MWKHVLAFLAGLDKHLRVELRVQRECKFNFVRNCRAIVHSGCTFSGPRAAVRSPLLGVPAGSHAGFSHTELAGEGPRCDAARSCPVLSVRSSFFFGAASAHTHVHLFLGCWPVACICSTLILETRQGTCQTPVLNLWSTLSSFLSVVDLGSRFCRYPVIALLVEHGMTRAPLFSCFFQSVSLLIQPTLSDYGNYEASIEMSGESLPPVFRKAFCRIGIILPLSMWPPSETAFLSLWEDCHPQSL